MRPERQEALLRAFEQAVAANDTAAALTADDRFHAVPVTAADHPVLSRIVEQLHPQIHRILHWKFSTLLGGRNTIEHHDELVDVCADCDARAAAELFGHHWSEPGGHINELFDTTQSAQTAVGSETGLGRRPGPCNPRQGSAVSFTGTRCPRSRRQPRITYPSPGGGQWGSREDSLCEEACGMAARRDDADGCSARFRRHGGAPAGGLQSARERVHVTREVVEPLLRRSDLLSQLLRIGYARDPRGQET
ncbi:FCD domain-containing protein [Streptomyces sp. NPDC005859]|uniref:FCD domain-containing protein n=1 Tax=Streptomyces sp. NPDC005859 TaxID=3157170 RepID=UPI00340178C1